MDNIIKVTEEPATGVMAYLILNRPSKIFERILKDIDAKAIIVVAVDRENIFILEGRSKLPKNATELYRGTVAGMGDTTMLEFLGGDL